MRRLMWFVIGFTIACAVGVYCYCGNWLVLLSLGCLAAAVLTLAGHSKQARICRMLFFGCAAAFLWTWLFQSIYLTGVEDLNGETVSCSVEITDYSESTDWGIMADGKIELNGKSYKIRVYSYDLAELSPADVVEGEIRLRLTAGTDQESTYHSADGIFLLGYLSKDVRVTKADKIPARYFAAVLKKKIISLLDRTFQEDTLPFARALLLGDRSLLSYEVRLDLSVSGIRHVVAVSGLHVSILFSVLVMLFGYRRVVTPILGWILLFLFAAVAGFTPSVVRACIMHALMLGSMMFQKEYDPPTALSFAVLTMLVVNPMAVMSVGLQLSAGCLVGIFLFSGPIRRFLLGDKCLGKPKPKTLSGNLKSWLAGSVSVTIGTWITTTPLCAIYFGTVSLIGVLTNLLTLWLITVIFCGILVVCILGSIYLPLGKMVAWAIGWPIRFVVYVAHLLSSFPLAAVYTQSIYITAWIVFCYVILAAFFLMKRKNPWVMAFCVVLTLAAAVGASWLEPRLDHYRFTVLDVGQGQSILIQNEGKNYLVDCGGDHDEAAADAVVHTLLSQGITTLDGVFLTHYDMDHAAGVVNVLSRISAQKLYLPDIPDSGGIRRQLEESWSDMIMLIPPECVVTVDEASITLYTAGIENTDNESSMCILFQPENCDILITGDRSASGERALVEQAMLPDLEVLVVGHHGAKGSATLELLSATKPEVVLISVGQSNTYGHPAADVLERLELFACSVLRTDQQGTIVIRG